MGGGVVQPQRARRLRGRVGARLLFDDAGGSHQRRLDPRLRRRGAGDQLHQAQLTFVLLRPPHGAWQSVDPVEEGADLR